MEQAWHVVEPDTPFVPGWHIDAICDHLQACTEGHIRKLVINVPPRHMKSLATAVFWPSWTWTRKPSTRWIFASYAESLSFRDSMKCRDVIRSPWYQDSFGTSFQLKEDQNTKGKFENTARGFRIASSVGGAVLGEGADYLVGDDCHKVKEVESETVREGVLEWWDKTMSTRGNDPKTVVKVIIMQRLHQKDLAGHVLRQGGWEHLRLPAEYEGKKTITCLGWTDPRTKVGEVLWPKRFDKPELDELKVSLGTYGSAGQLQQNPVPAGGGIIKQRWLRYCHELPGKRYQLGQGGPTFRLDELYRFLVCDPALTEDEESDYTAIGAFAIVRQRPSLLLLLDLYREQIDGDQVLGALDRMRSLWKPAYTALETVHFQKVLFQQAKKKGWAIREVSTALDALVRIDKDKVARTYAAAPFIEHGRFWVLESLAHRAEYELELTSFPKAENDDTVDVTDVGVAIAMQHAPLTGAEEAPKRVVHEDEDFEEHELPEQEEEEPRDDKYLKDW